MTTLELPFLLNVIMFFDNQCCIKTFILINKKCQTVLYALKKNPLFQNEVDLKWFLKNFPIETIDYCGIAYCNINFIENVSRIKNPDFIGIFENSMLNEFNVKYVFEKVSHLKLYKRNGLEQIKLIEKMNEFIIKYCESFIYLNYLEGDLELIVKFLEKYTNNGKEQYLKIPNRIIIYSLNNEEIELNKQTNTLISKLNKVIPKKQQVFVNIIVKEHVNKKELIFNFDKINYWYKRIHNGMCDECKEKVVCNSGICIINKQLINNKYNNLINKMYPNEIVIEKINKKIKEKWEIPKFIKILRMNDIPMLSKLNVKIGMNSIEELYLNNVENLVFTDNFENIKMITIIGCYSINFKKCKLNLLKQILIINSSEIELNLIFDQLREIKIINSFDLKFNIKFQSIENIEIVNSRRIQLPKFHETNKYIYIETSENILFGTEECLKPFLNKKQYKSMIKNKMEYKNGEIKSNGKLFEMKRFITYSNRIENNNNRIKRILQQENKDIYDIIISRGFASFDNFQQQQIYKEENGNTFLLKGVRYFEVKVNGYSWISIGCIDEDKYDYLSCSQLGWLQESIGYHSDDGKIYFGSYYKSIEDGIPYGNELLKSNTIGIGYDCFQEEIIYTLNGILWKKIKIPWRNIAVAITFGEFQPIEINTGENPFLFNIKTL